MRIIKQVYLRSSSELSGSFERKNKPLVKGGTISKAHRVISQLAKNTLTACAQYKAGNNNFSLVAAIK